MKKKNKLKKAPIHNLNEERSVGFINYEISIRGKQHVESASRKMLINKSIDIALKSELNGEKKLKNIKRTSTVKRKESD